MSDSSEGNYVPGDDPIVVAMTSAIQLGDLAEIDRLLNDHPWLPTARIGDPDCHRTLLHAATDWPGHFPNGPGVVSRLVRFGADVNAHSCFDAHSETALHWAASTNDVVVLDALLDAGADLEATGAVLGGGTALADACGFSNWAAARRLVERGARTRLKDAAALGLMDRIEESFTRGPTPPDSDVTQAFWSACKGDQREAGEYLLGRGADINWLGWDDLTPLDAAEREHALELAEWLQTLGAKHAAELR